MGEVDTCQGIMELDQEPGDGRFAAAALVPMGAMVVVAWMPCLSWFAVLAGAGFQLAAAGRSGFLRLHTTQLFLGEVLLAVAVLGIQVLVAAGLAPGLAVGAPGLIAGGLAVAGAVAVARSRPLRVPLLTRLVFDLWIRGQRRPTGRG